jgi:hypothetical protein
MSPKQMQYLMWTITMHDETVVKLTTGELNAIKKLVKANGRTGPQPAPRGVRKDTLANLVSKDVLRIGADGVHYFREGILPPA